MNCAYVHTWLMQVDSLLVKDWPRDMNRHLKQCADCAKLARNLYKVEEAWRDLPVPEGCDQAKAKFLQAHLKTEPPAKPQKPAKASKPATLPFTPKPASRPWHPARWVGAAAMILIAVSAFAYLFLLTPSQSRAAQSDIVERLIDWNLELTNADPSDRKRLFVENEGKLREDLEKEKNLLSAEELEIAKDLLENGIWLASNEEDVVAEAERVDAISKKLYARAETAPSDKDKQRCGSDYDKFRRFGVEPMKLGATPIFLKFTQFKGFEPKKGFDKGEKGGFEKGGFEKAWNQQNKDLQKIWERPRPDTHKKFDGFYKKGPPMGKGFGKR